MRNRSNRNILLRMLIAALVVAFGGSLAHAEDLVEFLSGAKIRGTVKSIDKPGRKIVFEAVIAGRKVTRTYTYDKIQAITYRGKRYELNAARPAGKGKAGKSSAGGRRGTAEQQIREIGPTYPDWYEQTALNYPKTLDLRWPQPAPKGWNNRKNVGQFIWDVINPNANRWREGVKFNHFLLTQFPEDKARQKRVMKSLGAMYFRFFQDYPRAAYWWKKAGVTKQVSDSTGLAECYFRLGDKRKARDFLNRPELNLKMVKLWGDMGDTRKALEYAEKYAQLGGSKPDAYLMAGDVCRLAGRYSQAMNYYQKVVDLPATGNNAKRIQRVQRRARSSLQAIRLFELLDVKKVRDGVYSDQSIGYEGPVVVETVVKSGRIESVRVVKHKEKQFYSAIRDVPEQIIAKQGVRGVDATSRATITAEAIINATAKALSQGQSGSP